MRILFILLSTLICGLPLSVYAVNNEPTTTSVQHAQLLNINTANQEQLQSLKGIGKSKAHAIIMYREEHGAFEQTKDIVLVKGVGEKIFLDNQHLLRVEEH